MSEESPILRSSIQINKDNKKDHLQQNLDRFFRFLVSMCEGQTQTLIAEQKVAQKASARID